MDEQLSQMVTPVNIAPKNTKKIFLAPFEHIQNLSVRGLLDGILVASRVKFTVNRVKISWCRPCSGPHFCEKNFFPKFFSQ